MAAFDPDVALPLSRWSATEAADPAAGLPPLDDLVYRRREGDPPAHPGLDDLVNRQVIDVAPGEDLMDALRSSFAPAPAGPFGLPPGAMPASAGPSEADLAGRIRGAERDAIGGGWAPGAPPPWASSPPATPTLPDPDPMPWDANDIEMEQPDAEVEPGMADSERFAPEHDADPLARAAEQQAEDAAAEQARIDAQAAEYDRLDPVTFADLKAKQALKIEHERAIRELAAAETDRQQLEANVKRREQATAIAQRELADVTAKAKGMADSSPFESWFSSRSAPQQFAAIVAGVFGGLNSTRTGGRNSAIDMFKEIAESDAAAKWKKLEARRGLAQDAISNAADDFREREAIRVANYEQVARGIEAQLSQLDPAGTQALKLAEVHRGVRAQQAAALNQLQQQAYDRADKMIQRDQEQQRIDIERAKAQADITKKLGGGAGAGGVGAGYGSTVTYEQIKANGWLMPAGLQPGQSITGKQYKAYLDTSAANGRISNDAANQQRAALETQLKQNAVTVPLPGGGSFMAKTDTEATASRQKIFAARQLVNMIDEVLSIRDRVGGESSWANSPEYQELQVLAPNILKLTKEDTQGMSSDEDMKVLKAAAGADNVTSFRSQAAKLHRARDLITAQLNGYLKDGQGYDGDPIVFPNQYKTPKPKRDTAADKMASTAGPAIAPPTGKRTRGEILANLPAGAIGADGQIDESVLTPDLKAELANAPDPLFDPAGARGISDTQNQGLEQLLQGAYAGDETAVRKLVAAGEKGSPFAPAVQAAAKAEVGKLAAQRNKAVLKVLAEEQEQ